MKKIEEYYLFVINAFLIAGLIAIGFWLQQNNNSSAVAPASTMAPVVSTLNTQSSTVAGITANPSLTTATGAPTATTSITAKTSASNSATTPTAVIRAPRENESRGGYQDE